MPELGSTSRKAGTSTREKMNESMPSMVHPPQAAQNARFWLDVSGTLAAGVSTTGLCMRGAGKKLDHRWAKKSRRFAQGGFFDGTASEFRLLARAVQKVLSVQNRDREGAS